MTIRAQWLFAACILLILTTSAACGRKTSPLVPDSPRPAMIQDIKAMTRDSVAFLSWPLPTKNVEGRSLATADVRQFSVYRAVIGRDTKKARYKLYAEIDVQNPSPAEIRNNTVFWTDANLNYRQVYGYRIRAISSRGGASPLSDEVRIVPLLSLAVPKGLAARAGDSFVELFWEPVLKRNDGSLYDGFIGYNIYRGSEPGRAEPQPLNKEPLRSNSFKDTAARNSRTYYYIVRSVDSPALPWKESLDSEEASAMPRDMTPPVKPTGLTVVSGVGRAFLTWNENRERDLAGYHVYRSARSGRDFARLTDAVLSRTTFSDETAEPGTLYYYRITAIDNSGNESPESVEKKAFIEKLP